MRHFVDSGVDPFEVLRRVGRVRVDRLDVLDLADSSVRAAVGLDEVGLVGDDYAKTQAVAAAGFGGLPAPSAALPGRRTLVVFAAGADAITAVRQPPPRLADLLRAIRPHRDIPAAVRDYLASLGAAGTVNGQFAVPAGGQVKVLGPRG
jgi:hypothetical protein